MAKWLNRASAILGLGGVYWLYTLVGWEATLAVWVVIYANNFMLEARYGHH